VNQTLLECLYTLPLLAQEAPAQDATPPGAQLFTFLPFILIIVLFYFLMIRPQKREQSRRQIMLDGIKKNDRVVTIGGIYGVVTNVQRESDEVTIKVDETTNTKLRITLSSIARVVGDGSAEDTSTK
jgi:preprotein translocase subunit YajC